MPQDTEELHTVLRVEGNTWTFLASKYKNRQFFKDMSPQIWQDYTNWLLGERVYLMQIPVPQGKRGKMEQQAFRPSWVVMLNVEYELRREAVKKAFKESRDLKSTLQEVMECAQLKEQYFTSPTALQGKGNRSPNWQGSWQNGQPWKWHKGGGKQSCLLRNLFALQHESVLSLHCSLKTLTPHWLKHLGQTFWVFPNGLSWVLERVGGWEP